MVIVSMSYEQNVGVDKCYQYIAHQLYKRITSLLLKHNNAGRMQMNYDWRINYRTLEGLIG